MVEVDELGLLALLDRSDLIIPRLMSHRRPAMSRAARLLHASEPFAKKRFDGPRVVGRTAEAVAF